MPARFGPLALAVLLVLAGCVGGAPGGATTEKTASPTTEPTATTTATGTTTADATVQTTAVTATPGDRPAKGTQFVSLVRLDNQSRHTAWPDNRTVAFGNLSERRQAVVREALDGQVAFGPDEANPFSFHDETRPRAVRYDGTWYYVRVAIV